MALSGTTRLLAVVKNPFEGLRTSGRCVIGAMPNQSCLVVVPSIILEPRYGYELFLSGQEVKSTYPMLSSLSEKTILLGKEL